MGYYYIFSEGSIIEGSLDFAQEKEPFSHLNLARHNGVLETDNPFQIILMSYNPELEIPNRITMMAPSHYTYVEFDRDSFQKIASSRELHQHNTFELIYILSGTLFQRIESERHMYSTGSFLLLNRNVRHSEEFDTTFCTISLSLSAEYFRALLREDRDLSLGSRGLWGQNSELQRFLASELSETANDSKNYIDFIPRQSQNTEKVEIEVLFDKMIRILISPAPGDTFYFQGHICQLLNILCQRDLYTTWPIAIGTQSESRIFSKVTKLLEENSGRVSREMLVKNLNYSGSYLNRIVQTYTGMNITQYSLYFALKRAAHLLITTDITVTDIVNELGFTNRTYFYSEFQKYYGQTPRDYRINHKK